MRLLGHLAYAGRRLFRRPIRSFLLLQGTVWGVAVAIFPSAVIEGTREAARTRASLLGADRIAIAPDPTVQEGRRFDPSDAESVRRALAMAGVPVVAAGGARVVALPEGERHDPQRPAALVAADGEVPVARGLAIARGRWLGSADGPRACVVEAGVGAWLGRGELRPGDTIELPGRDGTYEVVGVTAPRPDALLRANDLGFDVQHPLYRTVGQGFLLTMGIPIVADAWKRSERVVWIPPDAEGYDWLFLRVEGTRVKEAADAATAVLSLGGRSPVTLHPLVLPFVLGSEVDRFDAVQIALFLACLAMGAVVMANLGLLSVLRRRHELAIRRVEGATRTDIVLQMVLEGLLLTLVGIACGWLLGMLLAALRVSLEPVTGFTWRFPWTEALWAAVVAILAGLVAGLLPGLRAGAQTPVEGLADE